MASLHTPTPRVAAQVAALPIRLHRDGYVEVLLVTSRETRRWIIPKGWPVPGLAPHEAAASEALEEAGVIGTALADPFGHFTYDKRLDGGMVLPCRVAVHVLRVERELDRWREQGQRERAWFGSREAARQVCNLSLQRLITRVGRAAELAGAPPRRAHRVGAALRPI